MKEILLILFFIHSICIKAQTYYDDLSPMLDLHYINDANAAMSAYVQAYGKMTQRAIGIMHAVQPYREYQYELYQKGNYKESIDVCLDVMNKYVFYEFDNKGIRDMVVLAGDAASKLNDYDLAIKLYQIAKTAQDKEAPSRLLNIFQILLSSAKSNYTNKWYSLMFDTLNLASKTGCISGEFYYLFGKYYEYKGNNIEAKKMYKLSKKNGYALASSALKELKLIIKNGNYLKIK